MFRARAPLVNSAGPQSLLHSFQTGRGRRGVLRPLRRYLRRTPVHQALGMDRLGRRHGGLLGVRTVLPVRQFNSPRRTLAGTSSSSAARSSAAIAAPCEVGPSIDFLPELRIKVENCRSRARFQDSFGLTVPLIEAPRASRAGRAAGRYQGAGRRRVRSPAVAGLLAGALVRSAEEERAPGPSSPPPPLVSAWPRVTRRPPIAGTGLQQALPWPGVSSPSVVTSPRPRR